MERPQSYRFHNGTKAPLPFAAAEYEARLEGLRDIMEMHDLDAVVLTSMHNIAYYSGFLYCSFGRPYGLVVTKGESVTISAGIDAGQPWRRCHGDNLTYTDWQRDNFWRAVAHVAGEGRAVGVELAGQGVVRAEREVILSSGAIGSPRLLQLSGIGPADHLRSLGIPVVLDQPGVGSNFHDHLDLFVIAECTGPHTYDRYAKPHWSALACRRSSLRKPARVA